MAKAAAAPKRTAAQLAQRNAFINAIALQEGNNYGAVNTKTVVNGKSDPALGKYQVLTSNVAEWTKEALGHSLTPQQFLKSPAAQEQVARSRLGNLYDKYGPAGAASVWYSGNPKLVNSTTPQENGPSVKSYVQSVLTRMREIQTGKISVKAPKTGNAGLTPNVGAPAVSASTTSGNPGDWIGTLDSLLNPQGGGGFSLNPVTDVKNATGDVGSAIELVAARAGIAVLGIILFGAGLLVAFGPEIFGGALQQTPAAPVAETVPTEPGDDE